MLAAKFQELFGAKKSTESGAEDAFAYQLARADIGFEREVACIPGRKFRFDFRIEGTKILIEIQGGVWSKTRSGHSTGSGIRRDCEKLCAATLQGFSQFNFTPDMVRDGFALKAVLQALGAAHKDYKPGHAR